VEAWLVLDARQGAATKKIWMINDFDSKLAIIFSSSEIEKWISIGGNPANYGVAN